MKATYGEVNGEGREIFKNPKTDDGTKKSAKGMLRIDGENNVVTGMTDSATKEQEQEGMLVPVFRDGKLLVDHKLSDIRALIQEQL